MILGAVSRLEQSNQSNQFGNLARATEAIRYNDDALRFVGEWEHSVGCYFRLSGLYQKILSGKAIATADESQKYQRIFSFEKLTLTYLAPLEFVTFSEAALRFTTFEIKRFTSLELDTLLSNQARKVFYPYAFVNTKALSSHWFMVARDKIPARWSERMTDISGRVRPFYSQHPAAIQQALRCLALYNWGVVYFRDPDRPKDPVYIDYDPWASPFRPNIPFVLPTADLPIDPPAATPDLSILEDNANIDISSEEHMPHLWLDNDATRGL